MNNNDSQKPIHKIQYQEQEEVRADVFLAKQDIGDLSRNKIKELINLGHLLRLCQVGFFVVGHLKVCLYAF